MSIFGINAMKAMLLPRGRVDEHQNSLTILYTSDLMISQAFLIKWKLKPSGPGALSDAQEATASSISKSEKGVIREEAWSLDKTLKFMFVKVGRVL